MKALIINGSPREGGNSAFVCETLAALLAEKYSDISIDGIRLQDCRIAPCKGCNVCRSNGGSCVTEDDGKRIAESVEEADIVLFATPVYQSGVTAQTKLLLDRLYAKGGYPDSKRQKVYAVAIGADPLETEQYTLIQRQLTLLSGWQNWEFAGYCALRALEKDELRGCEEEVCRKIRKMLEH